VVVLIVREFEDLMLAHSEDVSLGELVGFSNQLEQAGFTPIVNRKGCFMEITFEEPSLKQVVQRGLAIITGKRLVLSKPQKAAFKPIAPKLKSPDVCPHCGLALKANFSQVNKDCFKKLFRDKNTEISIHGVRVAKYSQGGF